VSSATFNPPTAETGPFTVTVPAVVPHHDRMCRCGRMHTPTSAPCRWWGRSVHPEEKPNG